MPQPPGGPKKPGDDELDSAGQPTRDTTEQSVDIDEDESSELLSVGRFVRAVQRVVTEVTDDGDESGVEITGEQVDRYLTLADNSDQRSHARSMTAIIAVVFCLIAILGFVLLLSWIFLAYEKGDLLVPVLTAFGGLMTGLVGGFGLGTAYRKNQNGE